MKQRVFVCVFIGLVSLCASGQSVPADQKFSAGALKNDLAYLKEQLYNVHVYPYTELTKAQYDELFDRINTKLTDSLTATAFLKRIKPLIAYLCDEHAQVYLKDTQLLKRYQQDAVFLPISLLRDGSTYRVEKVLLPGSGLKPGDIITRIDGVAVDDLLRQCALFASGYPEHRLEKALHQFGFLYSWTLQGIQHEYTVGTGNGRKITLQGTTLKTWQDELNKQSGWNTACNEKITYQKIHDAGYITACSFNFPQASLDSVQQKINEIFDQVQKDKPKYLFIDISKNSGGQSRVGAMLINAFYDKPYLSFSLDFKRSEAYIGLLKSWKIDAGDWYRNAPEGTVIHFNSDTTFPDANPGRFKGKVFIVVGNGTFSSAMMMATLIKDNKIALITGETPTIGHPNKFGELYNTKLPNTGIQLLFGVKRWTRPNGDLKDNVLRPDIPITLTDDKEELIKRVLEKAH